MGLRNLVIAIIVSMLVTGIISSQSIEQHEQPRTMPLVPMMRLLLTDMQNMDEGIFTNDYQKIEKSAKSIADHPVMTEQDKKLVKTTLGKEMKRFIEFDMTVHHHADSIVAAAQRQEISEILKHYRIVQQGCVDCHTAYRTEIVEARE